MIVVTADRTPFWDSFIFNLSWSNRTAVWNGLHYNNVPPALGMVPGYMGVPGPAGAEETAAQIIAKTKLGSINRVFPSQFLKNTMAEIRSAAKDGDRAAQTALKLLTQNRFNK